jgi:hypothetical protein
LLSKYQQSIEYTNFFSLQLELFNTYFFQISANFVVILRNLERIN